MRFEAVVKFLACVATFYLITPTVPLSAQEKVGVQGWARDSFGRIIFDWPRPAKYRAKIKGQDLVVSFDRRFNSDFEELLSTLKDYISSVATSDQGRVASFSLKNNFQLRTYPRGNSIILDLRRIQKSKNNDQIPVFTDPEARPNLGVRVGSNKGFTRLVFDWERLIDYNVQNERKKVTLTFNQEAKIDVSKLKQLLPKGIGNPVAINQAGKLKFSIEKSANRASRSFRTGNRIVLDIYDPKNPVTQAKKRATPFKVSRVEPRKKTKVLGAPLATKNTGSSLKSYLNEGIDQKDEREQVELKSQAISGKKNKKGPGLKSSSSLVPQPDDIPNTKKVKKDPTVSSLVHSKADGKTLEKATPDATANSGLSKLALAAEELKNEGLKKSPAASREKEVPKSSSSLRTKQVIRLLPETSLKVKTDIAKNRQNKISQAETADVMPKAQATVDKVKRNALEKPTILSSSLIFGWPDPVGAAVFRRENFLWVVFDRKKSIKLEPLREVGKSHIISIEQMPSSEATVLRIETKSGINPKVSQVGTNWELEFGQWPIAPDIPIPLEFVADAGGAPQLLFSGVAADSIVTIKDPEVGDLIKVAPLIDPGRGIENKYFYPEFQVLGSSQGVALVPLSDQINFANSRSEGILLASEGGLFVSGVSPEEIKIKNDPLLGERLFNPQDWINGERADFIPSRQAALLSAVEVPAEQREQARLNFARFYFARGLGPEALGILRVLEQANPKLAQRPEFLALRGASRALANHLVLAKEDLDDPRLTKFREAILWRGFLNSKIGNWKQAAADFRNSDTVLRTYPEPLKTAIGLERIEAALRSFNSGSAKDWIDLVKQNQRTMRRDYQARLLYSMGLMSRANGNLDDAESFWRQAKKSGDPFSGTRSELALINLGIKQETVSKEQAIERLEKLRFQWRGDEIEFNVLEILGKHYLDIGEYGKGLLRLRVAMSNFPESKRTKVIAKLMTNTFRKLFFEGAADKLQPLTSLALFDEYRELTPAGPEGDYMIGRLADRLVNVDLLDRASDLLEHHIRFRLKGVKRSQAGTKLALVHLINRKPRNALQVLGSTFLPGLSQDDQDDRRRIRAKAMFELGKGGEAIALLAGDVSIAADQLRADIYWRDKNYREAGKVLQRLAGEPLTTKGYDLTGAQRVLNWAVAMRLDEDEQGLKLARELYGPAMKNSPLGDSFAYIASPKQTIAGNMESISKKITEIDNFEAFLNNYRKRLLKSDLKK